MDSAVATAFRAAREEHGVTITEAAAALDVDPTYLSAIEDGVIEQIASDVVAKAHVRVYARYLGYDSEAVLRGNGLGTRAPESPISRRTAGGHAEPTVVRRAPAAVRTAPAPTPPDVAAATSDPSVRAPHPPFGEVVDEPPDVEEDGGGGRRRLAALAVLGSILLGLIIAFVIGPEAAAAAPASVPVLGGPSASAS